MTATQVTVYCRTNAGQNHIFHGDITDSTIGAGGFTALTDLITSQGLDSLQGQTVTRVLAFCENKVGQGGGILYINPQNTPLVSINVAELEKVPPQWQNVNIGPIQLNDSLKVQTQAS